MFDQVQTADESLECDEDEAFGRLDPFDEFDEFDAFEAAFDKLVASGRTVDSARVFRMRSRYEHFSVQQARRAELDGVWQLDGFASAAAWLRKQCNIAHGVASSTLKLGRALEQLPATADAFAAGTISRDHVRVIAQAATPERLAAIQAVEDSFVLAAEHAPPKELASLVQYVTDQLDGDGGAAGANAKFERRQLHLSALLDGMMKLDGHGDADGGELVASTLDVMMEINRFAGDPRTPTQQRWDALVDICRVAGPHLAIGPGRRHRPQVNVVIDLDVLEQRGHVDVTRQVRADTEHAGRLSAATIERLTCDCGIARIITDGKSQPLDVGRTTRTIPPALWRALVARDGHCVTPGCDRPPGWCEGHHIWHWEHGGPTSLDNLQLLCRHHHRALHEGRDHHEHPPGHDPPV
jgi:hypothetical protein